MSKSIEIIYQELIEACKRSTARDQMAILKAALDRQVQDDRNDFSISTLAMLMEGKGGPAQSTMRNKAGERYKTLIAAYVTEHSKPNSRKKQSSSPDWVDRIEELDIRWLVKNLIGQNKKLLAENNALRSVKKLTIDMTTTSDVPVHNKALPDFTAGEVDTIKSFLSLEALQAAQLGFDDKGRLFNTRTKDLLSGPRLQKSLEKILTVSS
jgi:hypothetical protein